jgi:5-methylcytosine-specific restriction endonuclease McrA
MNDPNYSRKNMDRFKMNNPDYWRDWRSENRAKVNGYSADYKCKKLDLTPSDADIKLINFMFGVAGELNRQLDTDFQVDHIHPVKHNGPHHHHNLQLLTKSENCSKNAKVGIQATGLTVRTYEATACALSFLPGGMRSAIVPEA